MKILVLGAKGQLGQSILKGARPAFMSVLGLDRADCDITKKANIEREIRREKPSIIINCAAYTNVEKAEDDKKQAFLINRDACGNLAEICQKFSIPLIHLSTDYVFDGQGKSPYREIDAVNPINAYGASKLAGEVMIQNRCEKYLILRVSSIFSSIGNNFFNTMMYLFNNKSQIRVVKDQIQCPTSSSSIAKVIFKMCERIHTTAPFKDWGIYHYCNGPATSWYDFACAIKQSLELNSELMIEEILAIPASEYVTRAKRPLYSVLDCRKIGETFGIAQEDWRSELEKITQSELNLV